MRTIERLLLPGKSVGLAMMVTFALVPAARAQRKPSAEAETQPRIQLSFINSCRPSAADAAQIKRALALVHEIPRFSSDYEVSRGLTTLSGEEARAAGLPGDGPPVPSRWVRIQREFPDKALLTDAQYSLSIQAGSVSEVLVLHLRDTGEAMQILISTDAKGSPSAMLHTDTPPERVRIERFGKSSLVLARCGSMDQSAYEPQFRSAGDILRNYRAAMAVASVVPAELARFDEPGIAESREPRSKQTRRKKIGAGGQHSP